jgi:SAM domain (Sterile alpha motif)
VQEISDWLEKLGMSEYAQRFTESNIDFAILGDLTDQDLEIVQGLVRGLADARSGSPASV